MASKLGLLEPGAVALLSITQDYHDKIVNGDKFLELRPMKFEMPPSGGIFFLVATGQKFSSPQVSHCVRVARPYSRLAGPISDLDEGLIVGAQMTESAFVKYATKREIFIYRITEIISVDGNREHAGPYILDSFEMAAGFATRRPPQSFAYGDLDSIENATGFKMPARLDESETWRPAGALPNATAAPPPLEPEPDIDLADVEVKFDGEDSGVQLTLF